MKSLCRLMVQLARCTSGSALVEMTIILPIMVALMGGAVDFGMAYSTQATLGKSARDAARYLAGLPSNAYCQSWAVGNAKSLVKAIIPSATVNVTFNPSSCPGVPSAVITVQVQDDYDSVILSTFLPTKFVLVAQHEEVQVGG